MWQTEDHRITLAVFFKGVNFWRILQNTCLYNTNVMQRLNNKFCFARESSCQIKQSWWQKSCFVLVKRLASLQVWPWPIFFHNTTQVHGLSERKLSIMAIKGLCLTPVVLCCERRNQSIHPSDHLFFFFSSASTSYWWNPKCCQASWDMSSIPPATPGLPCGLCPHGLVQNASRSQRHSDLLRPRSSGSTLSSTWMSEFLTLFLRLS